MPEPTQAVDKASDPAPDVLRETVTFQRATWEITKPGNLQSIRSVFGVRCLGCKIEQLLAAHSLNDASHRLMRTGWQHLNGGWKCASCVDTPLIQRASEIKPRAR